MEDRIVDGENPTEVEIERYLKAKGKKIGIICDFDSNDNDYNHEFFLCDDGKADVTAWDIEIRKMENVSIWQDSIPEAIKLGLKSIHDFYNYDFYNYE